MSSMGELTFFLGLQVKQKEDGIFISQDKYVVEILKKFDFLSVKTASTLIETQKPLVKDEEATDVDVHLYRSMIGSLMYLTASRSDIMFAVCACSGFQVTPKSSHLQAVKRIFRYLKGQPKLGLWYPKVSSFDLEAYSDSDYAGVNLDRKSITGGCQFLGRRLISWQCKKQTIAATSTIEVVYVAAAYYCGQVLWIQDQLLDYGFNLMNTQIYIYNETIICIVKNPVFHSKIKHIEIRHHFIRDTYEKKLIQVLKIHTDDNVTDLLTKAFDVSRLSIAKLDFLCSHSGKPVVIIEASIRGDLLFNDVDGIDCLTNEAIFENHALMGYEGDLIKLTFQKDRIKKLEKRCKPSISHHRAWLRSVSLLSKKKKLSKRKSVSKQGRKNAKSRPTKDDSDKLDAELDEDIEYMDIKEALKEGRQSTITTARPDISTARPDVSTARPDDDTARPNVSTTRQELSTTGLTTTPTTSTIFDDEEMTLANTLIKLKDDKAKGIARDEEIARQLEVELQAEVEMERQREEQASMYYIANLYDEVQARIDADHKLAVRWTHEKHEKYTVDERAKKRIVPIGSEEDERMIRDMNKKAEEESSDKGVDSTKKRKEGLRKSKRQKTDVDLEEEEKLKTFLKIDPDEEGLIDYKVLDKRFLIIKWESKFYHYDKHGAEGIYYF
nr:putative ribonuclease H-like domain-containing protein [Tanacetum cinerariifolium]